MSTNDPAYAKAHYQANKQVYVDRARVHTEKNRNKLRKIIREAKAVPCTDCGVRYPYYVMQFDHIGEEKNFDVAIAVRRSFGEAKLRAEIALCEVVCANCHAERTHQRTESINPEPINRSE
jgi:hypothetical protein